MELLLDSSRPSLGLGFRAECKNRTKRGFHASQPTARKSTPQKKASTCVVQILSSSEACSAKPTNKNRSSRTSL